jgi:hypothetical protein
MPRHAALVAANILTAERSRDYFGMGCSAKHVLQEGVPCARKCGTCFSSMPELAEIQDAVCRGAGVLARLYFVLICHFSCVFFLRNTSLVLMHL